MVDLNLIQIHQTQTRKAVPRHDIGRHTLGIGQGVPLAGLPISQDLVEARAQAHELVGGVALGALGLLAQLDQDVGRVLVLAVAHARDGRVAVHAPRQRLDVGLQDLEEPVAALVGLPPVAVPDAVHDGRVGMDAAVAAGDSEGGGGG